MNKQTHHEKDPTTQSIIFLQNIVNGNNHNIINQSQKFKDTNQANSDLENSFLKKENELLKNEVEFLKKQLEILQNLFDKVLVANK